MTDKPDSIVSFVNVEKTYDGETNVVKNLVLEIRRGEFLTLLGPSGSGKTTTLMMLAGFEDPTAGDIILNGQSLRSVPPYRRNMGVVFQNYALFPHKTVAQNVAYPLVQRRLGKAEIEERTRRALGMVELDAFAARRPAQLSGGQQQRVALARALVFEPELVLMDEPLGALDKKLREQMQLEIKHLHEQLGMTVVYVTHDQGEALTMSDRVAIFSDGVIQQVDGPREVYEFPDTSFVANFVGENNNLHGVVEQVDGELCTVRLRSGAAVMARPVRAKNVGDPTTVSLRPERIELAGNGSADRNRLKASVTEIVYSGDHSMVRMTVPGDGDLVAKAPASAADDLSAGDGLEIAWEPGYCRALDPALPA